MFSQPPLPRVIEENNNLKPNRGGNIVNCIFIQNLVPQFRTNKTENDSDGNNRTRSNQ